MTAFTLDDTIGAGVDGVHIPGIPGIWRHDEPIAPEALGLGVGEMRDVVERLNLPLKEVQVEEAYTEFERATGDVQLPSSNVHMLPGSVQTFADTDPEVADDLAAEQARAVIEGNLERVDADGEPTETEA